MTRQLHLLLILLGLAVASLATAGQAMAHAALTKTVPADGSVVASAPAEFSLSFSEPVSPLVLKLIGPDGTSRALTRFTLTDRTLAITAPSDLATGTHVLSWRVVSEDGHPVGGSVLFSVGAPSAAPAITASQTEPAVRIALWLGKFGLYLGLAFGIGGVAFMAWAAPLPAPVRRPIAGFLALGLLSLPIAFAAQGLDALTLPLSGALQPAAWQAAAASSFGRTALIATLGLLVALIALGVPGRSGRLLAIIAWLGTGAALAASGHASAAEPQFLTRPAVFLHAIGMAGWAGALLPLALALRQPDGAQTLQRFSRRIPVLLLFILLSGLALAIVQVERPQALLTTPYGLVLTGKLALVAALIGLGAFNRYRLTDAAVSGRANTRSRLTRIIAAEIAIIVAILAVVALWRFTPPPRALFAAAAQPASVHIHTEKAMADISLTPGRAGPVTITVSLLDGEFGPLAAKELRLALSRPEAGIEPIERQATKQADGSWRVGDLTLPVAGRWTIELEILVSDFEMTRLKETVEIRP
ncbi:Copper transport protein [Bosea sp. 62]|uniref:copper resistance CopC/CopD family protein n=1 Tax=unclassified Bosea (in: a-proteobacteria) TaxID=2653178 RepID=UPI00125B8D82|nr:MULTISPECIES: copper resistance protein CopC [unclassified Bosea (in: a-proteobacteria)]CAD5289062.1 Copper transport protein [Bosea sp. 21B]CAD5291409.1 Copper transport protein [Bosea sp. 46]CAD5300589.1 Copper transport protein [Bosea sp. 7B]VVT60279.1 Copper transport protein [Bosea sp. EC-HK365B]VXA93892.1 Copper transport protein [Bosea sp. 62]